MTDGSDTTNAPSPKKYAVLYVRMTRPLHTRLSEAASNAQMSLQDFSTMLLESGLGYLADCPEDLEAVKDIFLKRVGQGQA